MTSTCPGCGLDLPKSPGPTHSYVVSSPECWALFAVTQISNRTRLLSDAYMAQHPDGDLPQQTQSAAVHLVTLNAVLKHGINVADASRITTVAVQEGKAADGYPQLLPKPVWEKTIADVAKGSCDAQEYAHLVLESWIELHGGVIDTWTERAIAAMYR